MYNSHQGHFRNHAVFLGCRGHLLLLLIKGQSRYYAANRGWGWVYWLQLSGHVQEKRNWRCVQVMLQVYPVDLQYPRATFAKRMLELLALAFYIYILNLNLMYYQTLHVLLNMS